MEDDREAEEKEYSNSERVTVFIDGNNLYHRLKENNWRTNIDIGLLAGRLVGNRLLQHIYYCNARPPANSPHSEERNAYLNMVKRTPNLTLYLSWLQPIRTADEYGVYQSYKEKGGDTYLTTEIVRAAAKDEYDTAIIVASDGDYAPAAKAVSEYGKSIEVVYFQGRKPLVMEQCALMRAFRPGWAVPYNASPHNPEIPQQTTHTQKRKNKSLKGYYRKHGHDDDYQEDELDG